MSDEWIDIPPAGRGGRRSTKWSERIKQMIAGRVLVLSIDGEETNPLASLYISLRRLNLRDEWKPCVKTVRNENKRYLWLEAKNGTSKENGNV